MRLCQNSDGNDMAAVWIHKVRTGSVATGSFPWCSTTSGHNKF